MTTGRRSNARWPRSLYFARKSEVPTSLSGRVVMLAPLMYGRMNADPIGVGCFDQRVDAALAFLQIAAAPPRPVAVHFASEVNLRDEYADR